MGGGVRLTHIRQEVAPPCTLEVRGGGGVRGRRAQGGGVRGGGYGGMCVQRVGGAHTRRCIHKVVHTQGGL